MTVNKRLCEKKMFSKGCNQRAGKQGAALILNFGEGLVLTDWITDFGGWHKLVCDWTGMATQVEDDDDMDLGDWTPVSGKGARRGRRGREDESVIGTQGSKRSLEGNSSDDGSVIRKRSVREEFKIILKFRLKGCNLAQ